MTNFGTSPAYEFSSTHTPGTTLWRVRTFAPAGNLGAYATIAAALAAGQQLFPHYGMIRRLRMRVVNSTSDGPGSPWYFALNRGDPDFGNLGSDALRDQSASFQLGSDEVVMNFPEGFELTSLWTRVTSATDRMTIQVVFC